MSDQPRKRPGMDAQYGNMTIAARKENDAPKPLPKFRDSPARGVASPPSKKPSSDDLDIIGSCSGWCK